VRSSVERGTPMKLLPRSTNVATEVALTSAERESAARK
jgi:hypothetical protein